MSHLVVVSGLPGVGKTSVATIVAARAVAVHLSIDAVEESMLEAACRRVGRWGTAAYEATRAMAELNLRLGHDVVIDAVNDSDDARQTWRSAASATGAVLDFVYLMMSDAREHERRLLDRDRGLLHVAEPTWTDVQRRRAEYAVWSDDVLEFDTSGRTAGEIAGALNARLGLSRPPIAPME